MDIKKRIAETIKDVVTELPVDKTRKEKFLESCKNYPHLREGFLTDDELIRRKNEIYEIVEMAEAIIMEQGDEWFDKVTISRDMKNLKEAYKVLEKSCNEMVQLNQRFNGAFDDIGQKLSRYYPVGGIMKPTIQTESVNSDKNGSLFDRIKPQERWWENDPEDLMAYLYWLKGSLPPVDPRKKKREWLKIMDQLAAKHKAPYKDFSRLAKHTFESVEEQIIDSVNGVIAHGDDLDVGHQDDEPGMLKSTSYEIATYAARLYKKLSKYDQLDGEVDFPNWWQSKLILAKDYVSKAYHYLDSEEKQPIIDKLALEHTLSEAKYNTVEKVLKKLGRRPSEQELASFITKNYYDVTGVKRGDDDPSQNEKIVDLISFYNFDPADFEIAWHDAQNESVNEASGEFVVYVEKDNGRKKLLHTKKSQRAANMFMSKNMDKILNTSGIRSIGSMSKDEWEKKEAQFAENIKKTGMKTVTKKESVNESTPDQVIKDLDKAKNDLLKKVDALIAKKKKLYSDVDIEAPMSADEKKLDKDIADLFSQINKLVLQKRSVKKESVNEGIWPKSKLSDRFQFILGDALRKNFKGMFYVIDHDLYRNDKKVLTISDNDSVNSVIKKLKSKLKESVNEATKYKVGQKTPVGKIIGTSVWGKGRKQEWFYDVQKPGHSPKQYSEKSLDKIMGESVNEGPDKIQQFDDVHIKSKNLTGTVYSIKGNDVVVNTLKKGLVKAKMDDLTKLFTDGVNEAYDKRVYDFAPASDKIDEARSIGVVQREWGKTVDKMKSIVADWKGAEGSKKDALTKKLKDLTKKKKELEQELNDAVMSKGINQELSAVDEAANDYQVYHNQYSSAIDEVEKYAKLRGYDLDQEEYGSAYDNAFFKPKEGSTKRDTLALYKNGKEQKKALHIQIYGMGGNKYELNMYIN